LERYVSDSFEAVCKFFFKFLLIEDDVTMFIIDVTCSSSSNRGFCRNVVTQTKVDKKLPKEWRKSEWVR